MDTIQIDGVPVRLAEIVMQTAYSAVSELSTRYKQPEQIYI